MENIKRLFEIENMEDLDEIEKKIIRNKIELNNYIESNDYQQYESLYEKLISLIKEKRNFSEINFSKFNISDNKNFENYNVEENNLNEMFDFIKKLKDNYDNLFTISIEICKPEYHDLYSNKLISQNANFIFNKNNKPV